MGTLNQRFDDVALHETPPNGQGIAALMALGIVGHTPVRDCGPDDPMALHYQIEAMKLAFADTCAHVADAPAMAAVVLLDAAYLAGRARRIRADRAQDFGPGMPPYGSTVYLDDGVLYPVELPGLWLRRGGARTPASICRIAARDSCWPRGIRIGSARASARSKPSYRVLSWRGTRR